MVISSSSSSLKAVKSKSKILTLKSADSKLFEIKETAIINESRFIRRRIDDGCGDGVIPVEVKGSILEMIVVFCKNPNGNHHFADLDLDSLYDLLMAANHLHIDGMLDLLCEVVADKMRGKSPNEICSLFKIKPDFTPEQQKEIDEEHRWLFSR